LIARAFRLTPMELRVMLAIVEAGSVPATAEALGISDNTVKSHLKRLYVKTGVNRQTDLVKLMARLSSPLA
jgi:DNA-binding CsgD family transcriptional regulator